MAGAEGYFDTREDTLTYLKMLRILAFFSEYMYEYVLWQNIEFKNSKVSNLSVHELLHDAGTGSVGVSDFLSTRKVYIHARTE
jgi:hypothetical protein